MLKNYLTTAARNLLRHKGYALINLFGLATALACCLLMLLFVRSEWSYDHFHTRADRIYRAWVDEQYEDQRFLNTVTPLPLGPRLAADFPEVEHVVRVFAYTGPARRGATQFTERIHLADTAFFSVFDFPLRRGSPADVLADPNSVVLTEAMAAKYFGDEDPLGQQLTLRVGDAEEAFTVTGVAEDVPEASSIQFGILVPFAQSTRMFSERAQRAWQQVFVETYVLLRAGVPVAALEAKLPAMVEQVLGDGFEGTYTVGLQPIADIHLNPALPPGLEPTSDPAYAYILAAIALLVLAIACINFMTLSVGRSADRAKEVGVRKVVGARRGQLMYQFWSETLLLTALALVFGIMLAQVFLPLFNDLAGRSLRLTFDGPLLLILLGLLVFVGLAAGSYPAAVLSGLHPIAILKGRLPIRGDRSLVRRGLVVVQFALAIFLIAGTLLMAKQLRYLQTKNLGFEREQVVLLPTTGPVRDGQRTYALLQSALSSEPAVASVTASAFALGTEGWARIGYDADDGSYREFDFNIVTYDYLETHGMALAAGRSFSRDVAADTSQGLLINEAFARAYGWDDPIGRRLPGPFPDHEVIGVVQDFHYASLHTPVAPLVLAANPDLVFRGASDVNFSSSPSLDIAVRLRPGDLQAAMAQIEQAWRRVAPEQPYSFTFLNQALDSQYRQEERLSRIVRIASVLAILIACLGLFGLAALAAARRTKEIGVRKVLGASARDIVVMLSKDYATLVLFAFVVATPLAYLAAQRWLDDFAYRTDVGFWVFVLAGALALTIALLTVGYQAARAARANPVDALRYE